MPHSLKDEISNQKDEEIQAQIETFEATLAEKDQAVADAKAAVEAAEAKLVELEEALAAKNEELAEAVAKVEAQEAEAKLLARKTALVEAGATEEDVEAILTSFSEASDEMFEQVVVLAKKGNPFVKDEDKEDDKDEKDAMYRKKGADAETTSEVEAETQEEETDEAEAEAEAEVLEEAEEEVEAALTDAGDDAVEELSTVASEWLESNVLRTTANLK
jgi:colicin import membrane protein